MTTNVSMFPAPGLSFGGPIGPCPSGATYVPNPVTGAITSVDPEDIATLQASGFAVVSLGSEGITLTGGRNPDGSVIDATGGAGLFAVKSTPGTSLYLAGEAAKSNTKTDDVIFETALPATYQNGAGITAEVNCQIEGDGTPGTKTLAVKAYKVADDGSQGSNLGPAAKNMDTVAGSLSFAIAGTGVAAGDRLLLEVETALQETGGSDNVNARINSVKLS